MENSKMEPLLAPQNNRFTLFPIKHEDIWKMYKKAEASFWTAEEMDLSKDKNDWDNKLTDSEKCFIKNILAFFAGSDGIVGENLLENFSTEIQIPEVRCFYGFQIAIENIHAEVYSLLIEKFITDSHEKDNYLMLLPKSRVFNKKADWALNGSHVKVVMLNVLVAFAVVEGVFFSASFCAIFWLKKRGLMPGLTFSNELISRDEGMHTDFAVLLYSKLQHKLSTERIYEIVKEAVAIEKSFISDSISCAMIGMNTTLMNQYIEYVSDRIVYSTRL